MTSEKPYSVRTSLQTPGWFEVVKKANGVIVLVTPHIMVAQWACDDLCEMPRTAFKLKRKPIYPIERARQRKRDQERQDRKKAAELDRVHARLMQVTRDLAKLDQERDTRMNAITRIFHKGEDS